MEWTDGDEGGGEDGREESKDIRRSEKTHVRINNRREEEDIKKQRTWRKS